MSDLAVAFLFFLPAGISNMSPVIANKIPILKQWKTPIDLGVSYNGKRLLGNNKTMRGLVVGTLMGGFTAVVVSTITTTTTITTPPFIVGLALGFGALAGDAVESFFKRRSGVAPGESWFPFDQTDYIIGGLIAVYPLIQLDVGTVVMIFIMYFGLHLITAYVGYLLGLKDKPI